jgi:replicative DNA helicase
LFNLTIKYNKKIINNAELLDNIFFELKAKFLNPTLSGLPSGFYDLDSLIQGFQKSDLIIIAGRPSMGKTAFGLNIVLNIIKNSKRPILFFSLRNVKRTNYVSIISNGNQY